MGSSLDVASTSKHWKKKSSLSAAATQAAQVPVRAPKSKGNDAIPAESSKQKPKKDRKRRQRELQDASLAILAAEAPLIVTSVGSKPAGSKPQSENSKGKRKADDYDRKANYDFSDDSDRGTPTRKRPPTMQECNAMFDSKWSQFSNSVERDSTDDQSEEEIIIVDAGNGPGYQSDEEEEINDTTPSKSIKTGPKTIAGPLIRHPRLTSALSAKPARPLPTAVEHRVTQDRLMPRNPHDLGSKVASWQQRVVGGSPQSTATSPASELLSTQSIISIYYLIEDPSSSHSATGLAMKLKVDERDCGNTSMFAARSVVERIEKTTGQPLPDLTQCAHTSVLHHIDGHLALSSSTLSSLASVQILRNETHSAEDGDDLFFIDVPRSGEKVCLRFRLPKCSSSSSSQSTSAVTVEDAYRPSRPSISSTVRSSAPASPEPQPAASTSSTKSEPSPSRPAKPGNVAEDQQIASLVFPPEFKQKRAGATGLRFCINWIYDTADSSNLPLAKLACASGKGTSWWSWGSAAMQIEDRLNLKNDTGFQHCLRKSNLTMADYYALVTYRDLVGRLYGRNNSKYFPLIELWYRRRQRSGASPSPPMPKVSLLGNEDVWDEWLSEMTELAERLDSEKAARKEEQRSEKKRAAENTLDMSPMKKRSKFFPSSIVKGLHSLLVLFLIATPVIHAATNGESLATTIARISEIWPASLSDIITVSTTLLANSHLLRIAEAQASGPYGRVHNANLGAVARIVFGGAQNPSEGSSTSTGDYEATAIEKNVVLIVAQALGIFDDENSMPAPSSGPSHAVCIITTTAQLCLLCSGTLRPRDTAEAIWILHPASVETAALLVLVCKNATCGARHYPDHVSFMFKDSRFWRYDLAAEFLQIGQRIWATRAFVTTYIALLESNHVAFSSYATLYTQLYAPSGSDFSLGWESLWKGFVLHVLLELASEAGTALTTPRSPTSSDLVQLALRTFLDENTIPGALDHQCPECTRYGRRWKRKAGEPEGKPTVVANLKRFDSTLVEDAKIKRDRIVKMAVCDGIAIGHKLCAVPKCENEPEDYRSQRFCSRHERYNERCGVVGCKMERMEADTNEPPTEACEDPSHQAMWAKHLAQQRESDIAGFHRIVRQSKITSTKAKQREEDDGWVPVEPRVRVVNPETMWTYRKTTCIMIMVYSCGTIVGWKKLHTEERESPAEVIQALGDVFGDQLPTYIAYDRACHLLEAMQTEPHLRYPLRGTPSFIVDSFHFVRHSPKHEICRRHCDPTSIQKSDLVVPMVVERDGKREKERVYRKAFNTEAAEQLNSWLVGFASILRHQTAPNHDFLLQVLLRRRFAQRTALLEARHVGVQIG